MKLLDKAFDRAVEAAAPIRAIVAGLKACAEAITDLGRVIAGLAHNQAVQHNALLQLWQTQQLLMRKLHEGSLDMQMPDIDGPRPSPEDAAAIDRLKAARRPN